MTTRPGPDATQVAVRSVLSANVGGIVVQGCGRDPAAALAHSERAGAVRSVTDHSRKPCGTVAATLCGLAVLAHAAPSLAVDPSR